MSYSTGGTHLVERDGPSVAVSRRLLVVLSRRHRVRTFLRQQFKPLGLDVGHEGGTGPRRGASGGRRGRLRPVGGAARPQPGTAERRRDLDRVPVPICTYIRAHTQRQNS